MNLRPKLTRDAALRLCGVCLPLLVWYWYATTSEDQLVPTPLAVLLAFGPMTTSGELPLAILQSAQVFIAGILVGCVPGVIVGMLIGRFEALHVALDPYLSALYSVPTIALAPILIVAIGWGPEAKIVIIALLVFLPMCISSSVGVRGAQRDLVEMTYSFCSSELCAWRDLYFPSALPSILPGLRITVGRALTGLIVAEFSTSLTGLGNSIQMHSRNFEVAMSLVPVVVLILVGFALYKGIDAAEARMFLKTDRSR